MLLLFILAFNNKKTEKFFKIFIILIVIFFYFQELAMDYEPYKKWYYELNMGSYKFLKNNLEPIPYYIMYFLRKLNFKHNVFFLVITSVPLFINVYIISHIKMKKMKLLFFMFYLNFFPNYIGAFRQHIAASFFLLSIFVYKQKIKIFFLTSLSIISHYSAVSLIFFRTLLLFKIQWSRRRYLIILFFIILLSKISKSLFLYIFSLRIDNIIFFKLEYYLMYLSKVYPFQNELHYYLRNSMEVSYWIGIVFLNIIFLKKSYKFIGFEKNILYLNIYSSFIMTFFIMFGAITFAIRIGVFVSYGVYILCCKEFLKKSEVYFIILYFGIWNIIVLLYHSGIHNPMSPFSLV